MSAGVGTIWVAPVIPVHAVLGAVQTAAVAAAGAVAVAAGTAAVVGGAGTSMAWAVSRSLRAGADLSARSAGACTVAIAQARRWEGAVRAVAERNARVGMLRAACQAAGIAAPGLPHLTRLGTGVTGAVPGWTAADEEAVRRVERSLATHRSAALMQRLHAPPTRSSGTTGSTSRTARRPGGAGSPARTGRITFNGPLLEPAPSSLSPTPSSSPASPNDSGAGAPLDPIATRLEALLSDDALALATDQERAKVEDTAAALLRAAERAGAAAGSPPATSSDVHGWFQSLTAVIQDVGDAVERRRKAARDAATLLQPLMDEGPDDDQTLVAVRAGLLEVISGRAPLTDDLRLRALAEIDRRLARTVPIYLQDALAQGLANEAQSDRAEVAETADGLELRLGQGEHHTLRLALRPDHAAPSQSRLVWSTARTTPPEGQDVDQPEHQAEHEAEYEAEDAASCQKSVAAMDRLTERLLARGAEHEGSVQVQPGEARLPVETEDDRQAAADEALRLRRERERQQRAQSRARQLR